MSAFNRYRELQAYIGWTDDDALRVRAISPLIAPHFPALVDDFYAEIERHVETQRVITGGALQIARLKQTLCNWLHELFAGNYDRDYVERRWRVGHRHVEIGLNQVFTNVALSRLRSSIGKLLAAERHLHDSESLERSLLSLNMLLDLDLAIIQDAYQAEYQRRQATAERLATIGKIAGGIAHELRNPLNVVKTSVYFLLNSKNASDDKRRSHLERIERQVGIADGVITALNDFAKMPMPQVERVQVRQMLQDIVAQQSLPENITVCWQIESNELLALGDPAQLGIVFGNLVRNARDAMPEGGVLTIGAVEDDGYVSTYVQDSGAGIAPENLSHILEPLFSTKAKGIGLGLSITHDIIERHQGQLVIENALGGGARFTVRLRTIG
jgi:signal transduction histidine kinase